LQLLGVVGDIRDIVDASQMVGEFGSYAKEQIALNKDLQD
jgi:hypothetical protein